jgi:TPR repeat protein
MIMRIISRLVFIFLTFLMVLNFSSCATAVVPEVEDKKTVVEREPAVSSNAPGWASKIQFVEGNTHYFIGRSSGFQDKGEGHQMALRDALNLVSRYIKVELKSLLRSYEEAFTGDENAEMVQSASVERGAGITLREYFNEYYSELTYQGGSVLYDSYVKIGISRNDMERIKVQAANVTGWHITVSGSCDFTENEAAHLFKETATRSGWVLSLEATPKETVFKNKIPLFAFYAEISVNCKEEETTFTMARYDLIENTIVKAVTASGDSYCELKKNLFRSLRITLPAIDFPEYPDQKEDGIFSDLDSELIKLYNNARKLEQKGRLFPQKAKSSWVDLLNYPEENPFLGLAKERIAFYEKYESVKRTTQTAEKKDREKLKEIVSSDSPDVNDFSLLFSQYLETYGAYAGRKIINEIAEAVKDPEIRKEVKRISLDENINAPAWLNSCLAGSGAKCYLYSLTETEESREYKKRACLLQVEKGCSELAEDSFKKENGTSALYFGEKSCHLGNKDWCFESADIIYSGKMGLKPDVQKSIPLLIDSCETGEVKGCFYLGFIYEKGEGVEKNKEKSLNFYKKACELGHAGSCQKK